MRGNDNQVEERSECADLRLVSSSYVPPLSLSLSLSLSVRIYNTLLVVGRNLHRQPEPFTNQLWFASQRKISKDFYFLEKEEEKFRLSLTYWSDRVKRCGFMHMLYFFLFKYCIVNMTTVKRV